MNRAGRRALARQRDAERAKLPPLCPSGQHAFGRVAGTYKGVEVAVRVMCSRCRRLIEQVFDEQPEELARYRAWLLAGEADA